MSHKESGFDRLISSCQYGDVDQCLHLIENRHDVEVNQANIRGETVLIIACKNGLFRLVKELIDKYSLRCDPGKVDLFGYNALMYCCIYDYEDIGVYILENCGSYCGLGNTDDFGVSVLMYALTKKMARLAELILKDHGKYCNIGSVDNFGRTALTIAAKKGLAPIVEIILRDFKDKCRPEGENIEDWYAYNMIERITLSIQ